MAGKILNFLEAHAEKLVLALVALLCMWIIMTRVVFSPNRVEYENRSFSSGQIDSYVLEKATNLEAKISQPSKAKEAYKPRKEEFLALVSNTLGDIDESLSMAKPFAASYNPRAKGKYTLPAIGELEEVQAEHLRAAAYIPTLELNDEISYDSSEAEPGDLDIVTVEAKFDAAALSDRFFEAFAGAKLKEDERDPCLGNVIFGAVALERQERFEDGSWGEWILIPRTNIDENKSMFEIVEQVDQLPAGGIRVRLMEFEKSEIQKALLQPDCYSIASANEDWLIPSFHKRYVDILTSIKLEEKRQKREDAKKTAEDEREQKRQDRESKRTERPKPSVGGGGGGGEMGGMMEMMGEGGGGGGASKSRTNRKDRKDDRRRKREDSDRFKEDEEISKPELDTEDIYDEFELVKVQDETKFSEMEESLYFWAFDDTVAAGSIYRYRIRLGVFNPVAGTNNFSEESMPQKDDVILWSDYSDITEVIEVPEKMYMFASDVQQAAKTATVQIAKYELGYWYMESFTVNRGEGIGKTTPVENNNEEASEGNDGERINSVSEDDTFGLPEEIDFSTGGIYVDASNLSEWSGAQSFREHYSYQLLYSLDGADMLSMPVGSRNWPAALQAKYSEIRKAEKEPKESFRPFASHGNKKFRRRKGGGDMGEGGEGEMMEMMEMMGIF
jgi:hypothetical protein